MNTVTSKQIAALRYLIARVKFDQKYDSVADIAKVLLWKLIEASRNLTRTVHITVHEDDSEFARDEIINLGFAIGSMMSSNGTTHLEELMHLMGTECKFKLHYGSYLPDGKFGTAGQFSGQRGGPEKAPARYTFWLGPHKVVPMDDSTTVAFTRKDLQHFDLSRSGLYPTLKQN